MKLSELKEALQKMEQVTFILPNGSKVPSHFHLTEIGLSTKTFLDCGGKKHEEKKAILQLWTSIDYHHRLKADKLLKIIDASSSLFAGEDLEVEVEYETDTVGKYGVNFENDHFRLLGTQTDCLATDICGIDAIKTKVKTNLADLGKKVESCCEPSSGCC